MFPSFSPKLGDKDTAQQGSKLDFKKPVLPTVLWGADKGDNKSKRRHLLGLIPPGGGFSSEVQDCLHHLELFRGVRL